MRIIVIGAGLCGPTAAWGLHMAQHEVIVLEARNRVDGRIWPQRLGNDQITDCVGNTYSQPSSRSGRSRRRSAEVGGPILTHNVRYGRRTLNGRVISFEEFSAPSKHVKDTFAYSGQRFQRFDPHTEQ